MVKLVAQMSDLELEEAVIAVEDKIRVFFPQEWTEPDKIGNAMQIMFHFKLYGLDWRNDADFIRICMTMHKLKILEVSPDRSKIRRAAHIVNIH